MKTYLQHLEESAAKFDAERFKSLSRFLGAKALNLQKTIANFNDAIDSLGAAVEAGEIYNARFKELKLTLDRHVERCYESVWHDNIERLRALSFMEDGDGTLHSTRDGKKFLKHWKRHEDKYPAFVEISSIIADLHEVMEKVKATVKAGKAPKPADPNKFVKPAASYNVQKEVQKILEEAVAPIRLELIAGTKEDIRSDIEKVRNALAMEKAERSKFFKLNKYLAGLVYQVTVSSGYTKPGEVPAMKPEAELAEWTEKTAIRHVDDLLLEFVGKNTSKLSLIIEKKTMTDHKVVSNRVHNRSLENTMSFGFSDGSSFLIYSQVEYSQSSQGTPFVKLVTRFTNVVMADGSKMKMPSEEKMIKEF